MNAELITRLVKLIEKTGDRVILPDIETGKAVVVMDLDAYERLAAARPDGEGETVKPVVSSPAPTPAPSAEALSVESAQAAPVTPFASNIAPVQHVPTPSAAAEQPVVAAVVPEPVVEHRHAPAPAPAVPSPAPESAKTPFPPENKAKNRGLTDLTQEELLDRINRDIDDWKTAQDARRTDELRSAVHGLESSESTQDQLEEEERFFLEPIE